MPPSAQRGYLRSRAVTAAPKSCSTVFRRSIFAPTFARSLSRRAEFTSHLLKPRTYLRRKLSFGKLRDRSSHN